MSKDKPSIVIKRIKKAGHGGHHGGAWKVAYADFVTAMMAFFLLLWLLQSQPVENLSGIADYFTPSVGLRDLKGSGFRDSSNESTEKNVLSSNRPDNQSIIYGSEYKGSIVKTPETSLSNEEKVEAKNFAAVAKDLYKAIHDNPETQNLAQAVQIDETPEGLRIQIMDQDQRPMFIVGTFILQPYTKKILTLIAKYVKFIPNYVAISGHTSRDLIPSPNTVDNFELSAKRANATRKFLEDGLLESGQIERVVGKADQEPLDKENPNSYANIRIAITLLRNSIVPYQKQAAPDSILFHDAEEDHK
jgi:chemotaxis protein MotB